MVCFARGKVKKVLKNFIKTHKHLIFKKLFDFSNAILAKSLQK